MQALEVVVRYSQWRGKSSTKSGLTVVETVLGSFLLCILIAGFAAVHKERRALMEAHACAERQWRWQAGVEELEWKIRRWQLFAPACMAAGFVPIEAAEKPDEPELWQLISSSPLVRPMESAKTMVVSAPNQFASNQDVLLCGPGGLLQGKIENVHQGVEPGTSVLKIDYPNAEFGKFLPMGTWIVNAEKSAYKAEGLDSPEGGTLYEYTGKKSKKRVARLFDRFSFKSEDVTDKLKIDMNFRNEDCKTETEFFLPKDAVGNWDGNWYLRDSQLVFEPWTAPQEAAKVES